MNEYIKILENQKEELVSELKKIAVQNEHTGDWVATPEEHSGEADKNVAADTAEDWNERRAILSQLEMRFHNISLALDKVEKNTFGICEVCQEKIEEERLTVNPSARTCKLHLERERELPL